MKTGIEKIRKLGASNLVKVFSTTFISTAVRFASNFVSGKIIAVYIGPAGLALFGQLTNATAIFLMLASGAINVGITKYLAEHSNEPAVQRAYVANALLITLYCSCITAVLIFLFGKSLSIYLFNSREYYYIICILAASIIFSAFNNILLSIINGFQLYKRYVKISIFSSLLMMLFTILLVKKWRVEGALVAYIAAQSVVLIISYYFVRNEAWADKKFWKAKPDKKILLKLSKFTLMTAVSAFVAPISAIIIRKFIVGHLSMKDAGIWEGICRISMTYLTLITSSLQVYYLPRLSELKSKIMIRKEILQAYKFILPVLLLVSILIFLFRSFIINILFSSEFLEMKDLFFFQLIGDFFKVSGFLIAFLMWAKGLIKLYVITEIFFTILYITLSYVGLHYFGLQGVVKAYALTYFIYFVFFLFFFRNYIFEKENRL